MYIWVWHFVQYAQKRQARASAFYVQYAHARANRIFEKLNIEVTDDVDYSLLSTDQESDIIMSLYKIKDVISEGLGIRRDINLAYFLNEIDETNEKVKRLESQLNIILNNQKILDHKLNKIIELLNSK